MLAIGIVLLGSVCRIIVAEKPPHIVLIVSDDYGWNDIGYHNSEIKTPNLDKLATEGVKLENYYVQPICTPTRSQLLSGRYQIHTGLQHDIVWWSQPNGLPLDNPTMADKMKEAGYVTHMVGKWHIGFYKKEYLPTNRGFDTFYGFYSGGEDYYTHSVCAELLKDVCGYDFRDDVRNASTVDFADKGKYSTDIFAERAVDIIKKHNASEPMFMYVALQAVHSPLEVAEKYENMYDFIKDKHRRIYAGMTTCMDDAVGNITSALQENSMWKDTVLVFSTDNGGEILAGGNNWPLRGWKHSLWEGGMRGVGFVHGNRLQMKGTVNRGLIHVSDWFPTLVGLANGTLNGTQPLDGFDQWRTISEGKRSPRTEILHNIDPLQKRKGSPHPNSTFDTTVRAALRVEDWKIITGDPGNSSWIPPPQLSEEVEIESSDPAKNLWLFNIAVDPEERDDLSAQYPDIVAKLLDRLSYYNSTAVPARYPPPDPQCNPKLHGGVWGPWET